MGVVLCNRYTCSNNHLGDCDLPTPLIVLDNTDGACNSQSLNIDNDVIYPELETQILSHPLMTVDYADVSAILPFSATKLVEVTNGTSSRSYVYGNVKFLMAAKGFSSLPSPIMSMQVKGKLSSLTPAELIMFFDKNTDTPATKDIEKLICYYNETVYTFTALDTEIPIELLGDGEWFEMVDAEEWFDLNPAGLPSVSPTPLP